MWDTKSCFTAQTSSWCGMASLSESGFLSKVCTSAGGFKQNDPSLRRWQSLSHLGPERATHSSRAAQGGSSLRHAEVVQWLQEGHEQFETQLDRLKTRDMQLSYNITTAQLLDKKHNLSEVMKGFEQEKEAVELHEFEKSKQCREINAKVLKLEKDLLQMRSDLDRGGNNDQPTERAPGSPSRTLPEKEKFDAEMWKLRESLRQAQAKVQEEERNKVPQHLQTSTETQRTLLSQIEEMNKRLSHTAHDHSELQKQLSEANNKISQACLEKAVLSTQVLHLEDNIKELKAKLTEALSDKDHLIQEKAGLLQGARVLDRTQHGSEGYELLDHLASTDSHNSKQDQEAVLMTEDSKALREENEKLSAELEMIKERLEILQHQTQEQTDKKILNTKQIADLEAQCAQLIKEKEELQSKIQGGLTKMQEKCCQHREAIQDLELENQKLQDQCLCLEAEMLDKEKMLHMQEEEYHKQDAVRVQSIEELQAVVSHWTEKWQKVALTLQSTQEELEELKNSRNKGECISLLKDDLENLDLESTGSRALLHRYNSKGGKAVQTQDKGTETGLSESSFLWETPSDSSQNRSPQVQSRESQRLKQKFAKREKELSEKEHALKTLERLRETERTEAQIKISALELKLMRKVSDDVQNDGGLPTDVSTTDSLKVQLDDISSQPLFSESQRKVNQMQPGQKLQQTQRPLYPAEDGKHSVESRKGKTVCPVNLDTEQQRRMVAEQLKSLFKEQEGKEARNTGASSAQERSPTVKVVRGPVDRRNWQQGSGLMPVFEEDEETSDSEVEEGEVEKETPDEERQQVINA